MATPALIKHQYHPHGAARDLFLAHDPEVLASGAAGTGKSVAILEKLLALCLKYPDIRVLMVRKTATSLRNSILVTFKEKVAKEFLAAKQVKWYGGSAQEPAQYRFRNGSIITLAGMDQSSRVLSTEFDVIYVNEAIELTENDWETLSGRLRNNVLPFQQLIADTNPAHPTHWLYQRALAGKTRLIQCSHTDNPTLYDPTTGELTPNGARYIDRLKSLTGIRLDRYFYGRWSSAEGVIYEDFSPEQHIVDPFTPPRDWPRFWSIDWGYTVPTVIQRWALDPTGCLYLYAEHYQTQTLAEDLAKELKAIVSSGKEPQPQAIICDHDAEDRATFEKHFGQSTIAAKKTVSDGIQAVMARMKPDANGINSLKLMRDVTMKVDQSLIDAKRPTSTAEEIPGYVWDSRKEDKPMKSDDHGCDAMRYVVAHLDLQSRSRMLGYL